MDRATQDSFLSRPNLARRFHRARGFTLLELLVVAMLGSIVIVFISNASIWYSRSIQQMRVSSILDRELKLAAQAIAQDYGPALAARTTDGTDVQFDYDDDANSAAQWGAPDSVVQYVLDDGKLLRRNLSTGVDVPLARNLSALTAELVDGHLSVHLTAAYGSTDQELTLQLRDPS